MSEERSARIARVVPGVGIAILAGALGWLVTPPVGLVMHWGSGEEPGWSMSASAFSVVAALTTLLLGYWANAFVAKKTGLLHVLPGYVAAATLCLTFAGLQHFGVGAAAFFGALALAAAVYAILLRFSLRRANSVSGEPEPETK